MNVKVEIKGFAMISKNIINRKSFLKFCVRLEPTSAEDTGWIFTSKIDDAEYCSNIQNFEFVSYLDIIEKYERAVVMIFNMPVGTDIQLAIKWGRRFFADSVTGKELDTKKFTDGGTYKE